MRGGASGRDSGAASGAGWGTDSPIIGAFTILQVYVSVPIPDKPNLAFQLASHAVIALSGRDAGAFAQAQCMNDLTGLGDGQWQWNGWLNAQGRVLALFALLRRDPQAFWLIVHDHPAQALADALRRFVFRSKLAIDVLPLACNGVFAPPSAASGKAGAAVGDAVELDLGGDGGPRTLRIEALAAPADGAGVQAWRAFDLAHGLPHLAGEPKWTPQQLSLDRLAAYSVKKGCYPGQEIVARTHFLGQAKRTLALFEADAPLQPGDAVASGAANGTVVSVAGASTLAVVGTDAPAQGWTAAGVALERRGLLAGLAR